MTELFGHATVQDAGRPGHRKFGVPPGGAFDTECLQIANALLGNAAFDPAIEFALGTMSFRCEEGGRVAVVGACPHFVVNGEQKRGNDVVDLLSCDTITLAPPVVGLRTYVALAGGVACDKILGSASGNAVQKGDVVSSVADATQSVSFDAPTPSTLSDRALRVMTTSDEDAWTRETYEVTNQIDRVGLRLDGPTPSNSAEAGDSEPSVFGAVQLTSGGGLIVHGPDGPTIGGYVKLGVVIRADLDRLGQLRPGDKISFEKVRREGAERAWRERCERLRQTVTR